MVAPIYPGRALRVGDDRKRSVALLQAALESAGHGPLQVDGVFGARTLEGVLAFQSRSGLVADGVVGTATWQALFARERGPMLPPPGALAAELLRVAAAEVGTRESGGPNRGPRVDEYLRNVGLEPTRGSYPWCAAFVYYCFTCAARALSRRNPCVKTAGCMEHWRRAPRHTRLPIAEVLAAPEVVPAGAVFVVDHGRGKGHTGLVERVAGGMVHTIEGNTDPGGSREGDGVYRRIRPVVDINTGFIDYMREAEPAAPLEARGSRSFVTDSGNR
jgi:hypothetical protein